MSKPEKRHLYIAGFMGTGKSTIGPLLAKRLGRVFHDLDRIVESVSGQAIEEIFRIEGEQQFRQREIQALESIVEQSASVIALGGGAPTVPRVAEFMRQTGWTVLLTADYETIFQRLIGDTSRPLLRSESNAPVSFDDFKAKAETIMVPRRAVYSKVADWTIDTSQQTSEANVDRIIAMIASTIDSDRT